MFVTSLAEVDLILSQVNILLSKVNEKLDQCPVESRPAIVPRVFHIVSELEWTMSLSEGGSECGDNEEVHCTYSGALSQPPPSCSSSDTESMTWDSFEENFYKIYYDENEADDEDEEIIERKYDIDDHGPIKFSTSSHDELPTDEDDHSDIEAEQNEEVTDVQIEDECSKYVKEMSTKISLLAPDGKYKVTKPLKYKVDFTKMNSHFIRNIPEPVFFPVLGCSQDPMFYCKEGMLSTNNPERNYYNKSCENRNYRYPHGGIYGYETDVGIVPVPAEPIHGHVWKNGHEIRNRNDGKWIVHAEVDDGLPSRGSWSPPRRRG